jgi:hypothetical protein
MKAQIRASILGIVAAMMLGACASKGAISPTGIASAGSGAQDELASEYQSLIDNVRQQVVCRREAVTGSRIQNREVCITRAAAQAERESALMMVDDMRTQSRAMSQPMPEHSTSIPSTPPRP